MSDATITRSCSRCGRPISLDAPEGLCVSCLFVAGTETITNQPHDDATMASVDVAPHADHPARFEPGDTYGPYRLGRLLGRGGMGEVYEAEQLETGRRVALKVLRSRLQDAGDRARFLREGQLAASISHPHTVYVFGSDEIAGMPVISMELLAGGTLKDRVVEGGPLPPAAAVAAVLDIIGGLDAAQAAGILHRDIKPSNIFTDAEGAIKVGDFGLSISTLARGVVREGTGEGFQGTPQFAPPEQLRGEPLDVRADIYAVGATLHYLLTGQPPFDAPDLKTLFDRVLNGPPPSPRLKRREVPQGLAAIVLQCLAKAPADRPPSYAALAEVLRPFAEADSVPASLPLRFVAGVIDSMLLAAVNGLLQLSTMDLLRPDSTTAYTSRTWLISLSYFVLLEGLWSASIGKRLFGLKVTAADMARASWQSQGAPWRRIAVRTPIFLLPGLIMTVAAASGLLSWTPGVLGSTLQSLAGFTMMGMVFLTARRTNGWAGIHDLISGTRVVMHSTTIERVREADQPIQRLAGTPVARGRQFGPFSVVADAGVSGDGHLFVGFDPILERQVWIRTVPPGTPPTTMARRDLSRIGRLHWLTGRRSNAEDWDAFEAPDGLPVTGGTEAVTWPVLKLWLHDVVTELTASVRDGEPPSLSLDRLWRRNDGHLVILDFPAPGAAAGAKALLSPVDLIVALVREFRGRIARSEAHPMPLGAHDLLDRWATSAPADLDEARDAIARAGRSVDRVSAYRRAVPFALSAFPVLMMTAVSVFVVSTVVAMTSVNQEMFSWLEALRRPKPDSRLNDPAIHQAAEHYVAARWGASLKGAANGLAPTTPDSLREAFELGAAIAARYPSVSDEELARVTETLAPEIERVKERARADAARPNNLMGIIFGVLIALAALLGLIVGVVSSLAVRGGFVMRAVGLAVVDQDGREIGRMRSLIRVLIAWLPALVWLGWLATSPKIQGFVPSPARPLTGLALFLGCAALGAALTFLRPTRGPHDWLTGTTVIPR